MSIQAQNRLQLCVVFCFLIRLLSNPAIFFSAASKKGTYNFPGKRALSPISEVAGAGGSGSEKGMQADTDKEDNKMGEGGEKAKEVNEDRLEGEEDGLESEEVNEGESGDEDVDEDGLEGEEVNEGELEDEDELDVDEVDAYVGKEESESSEAEGRAPSLK